MVIGDDVTVLAHDNARPAATGRNDRYDRRAYFFVDLLAPQTVDHVVIIRIVFRRVGYLHGGHAARRGAASRRRAAVIGNDMPDHRTACKQQAGRRDAAQADDNALPAPFLLFRRLRLAGRFGMRRLVWGLVRWMLHRRLVRSARFFGARRAGCLRLFPRRLLRSLSRLCRRFILRLHNGLLRFSMVIAARGRRIVVIEVVHCNGLPIGFVLSF